MPGRTHTKPHRILESVILRAASTASRQLPNWIKSGIYVIPGLSHGIRWLLSWAAPDKPVIVQVAGGLNRGVRMRLNLKTQKYFWLGTHEIPVQLAMSREIRPSMTVYDVGAHIGFFTLAFAGLVDKAGKVYAFEPLRRNLQALRENLALNEELTTNVTVVEAAISDLSGRRVLHNVASSCTARLASTPHRDDSTQEIVSITLDEFVFDRQMSPPHLLKLDIEGAEVLALRGAQRLLREVRPLWILELHGEEATGTTWQIFREAKYRLTSLDRKRDFQGLQGRAQGFALAVPL